MAIDLATKVQGAGQVQGQVRQSLRQGKVAKVTEDSRFRKMVEEEERKVQPTTKVVQPIVKTGNESRYREGHNYKKEEKRGTYNQAGELIEESGKNIDTRA